MVSAAETGVGTDLESGYLGAAQRAEVRRGKTRKIVSLIQVPEKISTSLTAVSRVKTSAAASFGAKEEVLNREGEKNFTANAAVARLELGVSQGAAETNDRRRRKCLRHLSCRKQRHSAQDRNQGGSH